MITLVWIAAGLALLLAAHAALNTLLVRRLPVVGEADRPVLEPVSLLLPARNEEHNITEVVADLLAQTGLADFEVIVLDDGSTDATYGALADFSDPRLRVVRGGTQPPPPGWLGKPWACHRLAERARGDVFVYVDADVRLAPNAVAGAIRLLRSERLSLVSAFPREEAESRMERLVQPMLAWAWLTFLPAQLSEALQAPSLGAANGQFVVVDASSYRRAGGHAAVRGKVIEDIELARSFRRAGESTTVVLGTELLTCRMYSGREELIAGYSKNVWAAFGGLLGSVAVNAVLLFTYVLPALALISGNAEAMLAGLLGVAAGVANRAVVARVAGDRVWPDSLAMPVSIGVTSWITAVSWWRHSQGTNDWKGRSVRTESDSNPAL